MSGGAGASVVVVNHNGERYLPDCLASVLREEPAEVLVVDSGSTDGSLALLARDHPGLRVVDLGANLGPAAARNAGLREASSPWVLCVDNDVVLRPGCLERLLEAVRARPGAAMAQARSLLHDRPGVVHYDGADLHYLGLLALRNWFVPLEEAQGDAVEEVGAAVSLCVLVDREAALAAGGFFEEMEILFEDTELCLRLRLSGRRVLAVADALCLHRAGTPGLSRREEGAPYPGRRTFLHSRNRWLLLASCYSARTLVLLLPALCAYGVVHAGFELAGGRMLHWLRGKVSWLRLLPAALRRRRALAGLRAVPEREVLQAPPLTFNPGLAERGFARGVRVWLDLFLKWWWNVVRGRCG